MNESKPESASPRVVPPGTVPAPAAGSGAPVAHPTPAPAAPPSEPDPRVSALRAQLDLPFQPVDYAAKGFHLDVTVAPDQVVSAAEQLNRAGFALDTITGVDWLAQGQMEVVYDYFHPFQTVRAVVRTRLARDNPDVPTISGVFSGANWHEREAHDFFGIRFLDHPDLTPFLLPEDATYHPLRKDFVA